MLRHNYQSNSLATAMKYLCGLSNKVVIRRISNRILILNAKVLYLHCQWRMIVTILPPDAYSQQGRWRITEFEFGV